jgi:aminopeptidase N
MKLHILLIVLLLFGNVYFLQGQNELEQANKALSDSSFIKALYLVKKAERLRSDPRLTIPIKTTAKISLHEWDGLCRDISLCEEIGIRPPDFYINYNKYYCQTDKEMLPKAFKKLYEQKGETKKNGYKYVYTKDDSLRGTLNFRRNCFDVHHYNLHVGFDVKSRSIVGTSIISFEWKSDADAIQIDAHNGLVIDSVYWMGGKATYLRGKHYLLLYPTGKPQVGKHYKVSVFYHGKPKDAIDPPWQGGFVWKKNKSSKIWAGVACEHLGASFWWPCKDHPADEPDSMSMSFEVPKPYVVISNGKLLSETEAREGYRTFAYNLTSPINSYNVTFYIGNFVKHEDDYIDVLGMKRKLRYFYMPHNAEKAKQYFAFSGEVLRFYEQAFGPYPFWKDGYGLVESPFAGMEHQSAIAIGPDYGKIKKYDMRYTHVKDDYLIVHETAHEWWGNSVTADDMAEAWLQEGFATYSEYLFIEHKYGQEMFLKELSNRSNYVLNLWPVLGNRDVNDNAFIGGDIYDKGALLLQNLRACVDNDSLFFDVLKSFAIENTFKTVSTESFILHVKNKTGKDYQPLFDAYLKQTDVPTLYYSYRPLNNGKVEFSYKWVHVPNDFEMPFIIKTSKNEYKRLVSTTKESSTIFDENMVLNFANVNMGFKDCPSRYFTYHNTLMR